MACSARRPIQLLATEWAPKKPKVSTAIPATMAQSDWGSVSATPASMTRIIAHSTLRRPTRPARSPTQAELAMPAR